MNLNIKYSYFQVFVLNYFLILMKIMQLCTGMF